MKPLRILMLIAGLILALPAAIAVFAGTSLLTGYLVERDDDGYLNVSLDRIETQTPVVTTEDIDLRTDPGNPDWVLDGIDLDVRLRVKPVDGDVPVFVGIGPEADVDDFLAGVAHDEIVDVDDENDFAIEYRMRTGAMTASAPEAETFWAASAAGDGAQEITWEPRSGKWAVVVMNADGSPGVAVDATVGARTDLIVPLLASTIVGGLVLSIAAVALLVAAGRRDPTAPPAVAVQPDAQLDSDAASPVRLNATLDPNLSTWSWLVKWITAIPHFIILAFLWLAVPFIVIAAGIAILVTGRYPRGLFQLNEGIMRWTWRVSYYAANGGIGTDEYPPFSFHEFADDHARLSVAYPTELNRPMVLVKWLLAIPHLIIVGVLVGSSIGWSREIDYVFGGGLLGLLTLAAGVTMLLTGRYPPALFDLIVGLNRWVFRTVAYVLLMTDDYPPFRLDQGGSEPPSSPNVPHAPSDVDAADNVDLTQSSPTPDLVVQ